MLSTYLSLEDLVRIDGEREIPWKFPKVMSTVITESKYNLINKASNLEEATSLIDDIYNLEVISLGEMKYFLNKRCCLSTALKSKDVEDFYFFDVLPNYFPAKIGNKLIRKCLKGIGKVLYITWDVDYVKITTDRQVLRVPFSKLKRKMIKYIKRAMK